MFRQKNLLPENTGINVFKQKVLLSGFQGRTAEPGCMLQPGMLIGREGNYSPFAYTDSIPVTKKTSSNILHFSANCRIE
jgi:hypothetical protein